MTDQRRFFLIHAEKALFKSGFFLSIQKVWFYLTKIVLLLLMGYLLGCLSPAALFSKWKNTNLRHHGTGNLGATNTMLVLGKGYGAAVMIFDISKAYIAVKLAQLLFPGFAFAGLLAGGASVAGHIFPFYLKFKGGKGLAAFGGMIMGVDLPLFLFLLVISLSLMLIINHSVAMPMSGAVLFPILYGGRSENILAGLLAAAVGLLIICKHVDHFGKIRRGEDPKIREYVRQNLFS